MSVSVKTPPFPLIQLGPTPTPEELEEAREQLLDAFSRAPSGAGFDAMASNLKASPAPKKCKSSEVAKLPFEAKLLVATDGTLGIGKPPKKLADELTAITTAAFAGAEFEGTKEQLDAIGARLLQLHAFCIRGYASAFTNDAVQARAAILALAQRVAAKAPDNEALTLGLINALGKESHMPLRDFATSALLQAHKAGKLPAAADYAKAVDQTNPPYDKWDDDGVVRIHYVVDNDGTKRDHVVSLLKYMKFKGEEQADGTTIFRRKATKEGALPTEIVLRPAPKEGERPPIFDKMDDASVDIVLYSGHAGYGQNVRDAVNNGTQSTGEGKLILLYQCSGITNTEDIKKAFPLAQFSSTTTTTTDTTDMPMFEEMIRGFDTRKSWREINADVQKRLKDNFPSEDYTKQYFYPGQSELSETQMDRDGDAMQDLGDGVFSVTQRPTRMSVGVDAVEPTVAPQYLGSPALTEATGNFTLILRNNHLLTKEEEKKTPWTTPIVAANGMFYPDAGDERAFRFTVEDDKLLISLSTHYAHADEQTLSRMLAVEAGQYFGEKAGLNAQTTAALSLAFVERYEHQTVRRYGEQRNAASDLFFFQRYGGDADMRSLITGLGNPDDLTRAMFVKLVAAGKTLSAPKSVGKALEVPVTQIDYQTSAESVGKLFGLKGTVTQSNLLQLPYDNRNERSQVYLVDHQGKTKLLLVSMSNEGWVSGARTYDFDIQAAIMTALDPGAREVYKAARAEGKDTNAALKEAMISTVAAQVRDNDGKPLDLNALTVYLDPDTAQNTYSLQQIPSHFGLRQMYRALPDLESWLRRATDNSSNFNEEIAKVTKLDVSKHSQAERALGAIMFLNYSTSTDPLERMKPAMKLFGISRVELMIADVVNNNGRDMPAEKFAEYLAIVGTEKDVVKAAKKLKATFETGGEYFNAYTSLTPEEQQQLNS